MNLFSPSGYHIQWYYLSENSNSGKQIFSSAGILSTVWRFHRAENEHYYPLWPPSFLSSLHTRSHTRYRNHFLCDASFRYTLDYSPSCPSPHHFPSSSLSSPSDVWRFSSPVYLAFIGRSLSIHPTLSHLYPVSRWRRYVQEKLHVQV